MAKICKSCGYVPEHLCDEIKELEYKLKVAENENIRIKKNWNNSKAQHKRFQNKLKEENKILIKALELACYDMTKQLFPYQWQELVPNMVKQYKEDAKEILNGH